MGHGDRHPALRRTNTLAALAAIRRLGLLPDAKAAALADHYRFLRRVSASLRLFGARPADVSEIAGPMPARLTKSLAYSSRAEFLADYRRRTADVRAIYEQVFSGSSFPPLSAVFGVASRQSPGFAKNEAIALFTSAETEMTIKLTEKYEAYKTIRAFGGASEASVPLPRGSGPAF